MRQASTAVEDPVSPFTKNRTRFVIRENASRRESGPAFSPLFSPRGTALRTVSKMDRLRLIAEIIRNLDVKALRCGNVDVTEESVMPAARQTCASRTFSGFLRVMFCPSPL